jgi:hypothetical protein
MSGVYLGAAEARELVGRWHALSGSDTSITNVRDQRGGWRPQVQPHHAWGGQAPAYQYQPQAYYQPQAQAWAPEQAHCTRYPQYPGWCWNPRTRAWERERAAVAPQVRDHRRRLWESYYPGVPFVGVEALMGAAEGTALAPAAFLREMGPATMANRQVLPMNTGTTPVPINATAQITSRPQRVAFRPERVFVSSSDIGGSGTPANWIVNDITIGNKSQFAQSGALPGDMFGSTAIDSFVTFETAQTAMDVVMIVTYQGGTEGGTPFYGSIIGTAAL